MINFCQFKGAITSKNDLKEKNGPNFLNILLKFYNKISLITIINWNI